jgi:hypothetical protein
MVKAVQCTRVQYSVHFMSLFRTSESSVDYELDNFRVALFRFASCPVVLHAVVYLTTGGGVRRDQVFAYQRS